jgi:hypothetical protein
MHHLIRHNHIAQHTRNSASTPDRRKLSPFCDACPAKGRDRWGREPRLPFRPPTLRPHPIRRRNRLPIARRGGGKPEERTAWVGVPAEDAVHHDEEVVGRLGLDGVAPDVDAAGGGLLGAHGWVVLLREGAKRSLEKGELVSRVCAVLSGATPSRERAADSDDGPVEQLRVGEGDVLGHPRVGWPRVAYRRRATGRFLPWVPPRSWRRRRRGVATGRDAPHRE